MQHLVSERDRETGMKSSERLDILSDAVQSVRASVQHPRFTRQEVPPHPRSHLTTHPQISDHGDFQAAPLAEYSNELATHLGLAPAAAGLDYNQPLRTSQGDDMDMLLCLGPTSGSGLPSGVLSHPRSGDRMVPGARSSGGASKWMQKKTIAIRGGRIHIEGLPGEDRKDMLDAPAAVTMEAPKKRGSGGDDAGTMTVLEGVSGSKGKRVKQAAPETMTERLDFAVVRLVEMQV